VLQSIPTPEPLRIAYQPSQPHNQHSCKAARHKQQCAQHNNIIEIETTAMKTMENCGRIGAKAASSVIVFLFVF
jgi:hypothetical protein